MVHGGVFCGAVCAPRGVQEDLRSRERRVSSFVAWFAVPSGCRCVYECVTVQYPGCKRTIERCVSIVYRTACWCTATAHTRLAMPLARRRAPECREPRELPESPCAMPCGLRSGLCPPHARAGSVFARVLIMKRGLVSHVATDRNEPHCLATASERLQRSRHSAAPTTTWSCMSFRPPGRQLTHPH